MTDIEREEDLMEDAAAVGIGRPSFIAALRQPPQPTGDVGLLVTRLRDMHALAADSCDPEFNRALIEAADMLLSLNSRSHKMETALKDAREFIDGMRKPPAAGVMNISSYHPCGKLVDQIDAALTGAGEEGE